MAVSADCRFSLSAAGQLHVAVGLAGRNSRLLQYANGELMGNKIKLSRLHHQRAGSKSIKQQVSMSLATNIAGESKVRKSYFFIKMYQLINEWAITNFLSSSLFAKNPY